MSSCQERTDVRWRPEQETSLKYPPLNLKFSESECSLVFQGKYLRRCSDFLVRPLIRHPGHCDPLAPLATPLHHVTKFWQAATFRAAT